MPSFPVRYECNSRAVSHALCLFDLPVEVFEVFGIWRQMALPVDQKRMAANTVEIGVHQALALSTTCR
jgi:hypothetical protein